MHMLTIPVRECASWWKQAVCMEHGAQKPRALAGGSHFSFGAGFLEMQNAKLGSRQFPALKLSWWSFALFQTDVTQWARVWVQKQVMMES